jgi:hypothetical protein
MNKIDNNSDKSFWEKVGYYSVCGGLLIVILVWLFVAGFGIHEIIQCMKM